MVIEQFAPLISSLYWRIEVNMVLVEMVVWILLEPEVVGDQRDRGPHRACKQKHESRNRQYILQGKEVHDTALLKRISLLNNNRQ